MSPKAHTALRLVRVELIQLLSEAWTDGPPQSDGDVTIRVLLDTTARDRYPQRLWC